MISTTTNPANWQPGEAILWRAVEAATDYELEAARKYNEELDRLIGFADELLGKETQKEETPLSIEARMALHRIRGEAVRMSPLAWTAGLGELARKGIIARNSRGWREA